jgi:c-di-GMP-binding flagellar brake protein YcgR
MLRPALWISAMLPGAHTSVTDLHHATVTAWTAAASCTVALSCAVVVRHALSGKQRRERLAECGMRIGAELISPKAVEPGTHVTIEMATGEGNRTGRGRMLAVTGRYVEIEIDPQLLPARIGTPLQVTLTSSAAAYRFHTCVIDHRVVDGNPLLVVIRPPWLERVQRRRFFRTPCEMPSLYAPTPAEDGELPAYRCMIYDLSAAGMCLGSPIPMEVGRRMRVRVPMPGKAELPVEMTVVRQTGAREMSLPHTLHCEYLRLPEETRDALAKRCFEIELRGLRNRHSRGKEPQTPRSAA